ncbi:hypothetical protein AX774_g8152 [Zancudomyces culisetae]|uniref:Syntaxin-binding protein 5 n=1 Tax=Zancudomyces culisetae TaxID=1213189 RepID=A0A1R1PBX5_ZANCU|nr:hypothetical protein AX774_g8152 [Zancudomyces culisetae]|eukprot:OMH78468.1 hypothetical protein AX774_g8152 [Zancudomyces culisetae]
MRKNREKCHTYGNIAVTVDSGGVVSLWDMYPPNPYAIAGTETNFSVLFETFGVPFIVTSVFINTNSRILALGCASGDLLVCYLGKALPENVLNNPKFVKTAMLNLGQNDGSVSKGSAATAKKSPIKQYFEDTLEQSVVSSTTHDNSPKRCLKDTRVSDKKRIHGSEISSILVTDDGKVIAGNSQGLLFIVNPITCALEYIHRVGSGYSTSLKEKVDPKIKNSVGVTFSAFHTTVAKVKQDGTFSKVVIAGTNNGSLLYFSMIDGVGVEKTISVGQGPIVDITSIPKLYEIGADIAGLSPNCNAKGSPQNISSNIDTISPELKSVPSPTQDCAQPKWFWNKPAKTEKIDEISTADNLYFFLDAIVGLDARNLLKPGHTLPTRRSTTTTSGGSENSSISGAISVSLNAVTDHTQHSNEREVMHSYKLSGNAFLEANEKLKERGEKLANLGDSVNKMSNAAHSFLGDIKAYNQKQANKKWWQF